MLIMKIAYIITAYTDALHLRRLVDSLNINRERATSDFYIHIDKKVDINPFLRAMERCSSDVFWCKKRYRINWGGFFQVKSQYELLRMIFEESKRKYDRVVCLSGTDYPLWSNEKIVEVFHNNPYKEYIGGFCITTSHDKTQIKKVKDYHFFRDIALPLKLKRIICGTSRFIFHYLPIHKPLYCIGDNGKEYDVYTGSDYWALTYDCAKFVFEVMRDDQRLMKYFSTSFIPSEGVVNTIVFNSKFKNNCSHQYEGYLYPGLELLTPLHHLQYKEAIKVYTLEDWNELKESDKMFFRKARTGYSDKLIEKIEKTLRS